MESQISPLPVEQVMQRLAVHKPLIQCITNFVSMDLMANVLLAAGASPAMVHCKEEVEDFQRLAEALVINVGTLTPAWVESMHLAAKAANALGHPWVLDPVGAGATQFRTQAVLELVKLKPTVIRGNASEIMAVAGAAGVTTRGVDSTAEAEEALELGKRLARESGCIVAISGATDLVTDGRRVMRCRGGTPTLKLVTATGCSVTALIAAFLVANPEDRVFAAAAALSVFGLAATRRVGANADSRGPGSLRVALLDGLHSLSTSKWSDEELDAIHITEDGCWSQDSAFQD